MLVLISVSAFSAFAIDFATYRKIDYRGMDGGEVLVHAGTPESRQRNWDDSCGGVVEKLFYRGTDSQLDGKIIVVELCKNKVRKVSLN